MKFILILTLFNIRSEIAYIHSLEFQNNDACVEAGKMWKEDVADKMGNSVISNSASYVCVKR